jgi:glycosyltransferase involved in cell wall biosynthesis
MGVLLPAITFSWVIREGARGYASAKLFTHGLPNTDNRLPVTAVWRIIARAHFPCHPSHRVAARKAIRYTCQLMMLNCSLGITAYNEEANIGKLLQRILDQQLRRVAITEIIVVVSGCTDGTEQVAREFTACDGRIRLLIQEKREGKASAMNLFIREAQEELLILCSADLLPALDAVEQLMLPFTDPDVGMTGCHPVPVNDPATFMGFAVQLQWRLHHELNMAGDFKGGEMVGFRRLFERIPYHTAVDEASIEPIVRGQGYRVQYCPQAIVANKGPETVADFLRQRRRIYAGHLDLQQLVGYRVSTMAGMRMVGLLLGNMEWRLRPFLWTWAVVALEVYGRLLGLYDYKTGSKNHTVWEIATTTKEINPEQVKG